MRYSNEELFFITSEEYQSWLNDSTITPREFFLRCINRLEWVIKDSLNKPNWTDDDKQHLLKYRKDAIEFYRLKIKGN